MNIERKNVETQLGTINFAYKKGDPLVVYLNGFGSFDTTQSFLKIIESLPNHYGIFAPDYLNSGFSGRTSKEYTLSDEAAELAQLINKFQAEKVVILAHSIGGVYALQMKDKVNNLKAFIGIEPTTREIILNPPKEQKYLEKQKSMNNLEKLIRDAVKKNFSEEENKEFWQTTEQNADKFDEKDAQAAQQALQNDAFWQASTKFNDNIPSVIITEAYRREEYQRSEYFTKNSFSKIYSLGSFHYIHFEKPQKIAKIVETVIDQI